MKDINDAEDLANVFKSGELINEKAIDDNLELLEKIFKDFKQKGEEMKHKNIDWENFEVTWVDLFGNEVKKDTYDLRSPEEKNKWND